ncbi:receptor-type tyrosine-protein like protein [Tanacetum coccineum]
MGNCLFGGPSDHDPIIKVINSAGGIMEFYAPVTAESITDEFPGHAIFRGHDLFWKPVPHHEFLVAGNSYYLLPLDKKRGRHVRSNSLPTNTPVPYRMSFDSRRMFKRSYTEANGGSSLRNSNSGGFWKVKLVISPEQLLEILSKDGKTQELIENVRTVAKCGNESLVSCNSSVNALSDQWSLCSSSRNGSKKDVVLEMMEASSSKILRTIDVHQSDHYTRNPLAYAKDFVNYRMKNDEELSLLWICHKNEDLSSHTNGGIDNEEEENCKTDNDRDEGHSDADSDIASVDHLSEGEEELRQVRLKKAMSKINNESLDDFDLNVPLENDHEGEAGKEFNQMFSKVESQEGEIMLSLM